MLLYLSMSAKLVINRESLISICVGLWLLKEMVKRYMCLPETPPRKAAKWEVHIKKCRILIISCRHLVNVIDLISLHLISTMENFGSFSVYRKRKK